MWRTSLALTTRSEAHKFNDKNDEREDDDTENGESDNSDDPVIAEVTILTTTPMTVKERTFALSLH